MLWCGRSQSMPANPRRREGKATSTRTTCLLLRGRFLESLYPANMQTCEWNSLRCNGCFFCSTYIINGIFVLVRPLELFVVLSCTVQSAGAGLFHAFLAACIYVPLVVAVWNPLRGSYPQKVHTDGHGIAVREVICCWLPVSVQ